MIRLVIDDGIREYLEEQGRLGNLYSHWRIDYLTVGKSLILENNVAWKLEEENSFVFRSVTRFAFKCDEEFSEWLKKNYPELWI